MVLGLLDYLDVSYETEYKDAVHRGNLKSRMQNKTNEKGCGWIWSIRFTFPGAVAHPRFLSRVVTYN